MRGGNRYRRLMSGAQPRWMFGATRLNLGTVVVTPTATQISSIGQVTVGLPAYPISKFRPVWANWVVTNGGATQPESDIGNAIAVQATYWTGTTWLPCTVAGAAEWTVADGATVIGDPMPFISPGNSDLIFRVMCTVTSGQSRPGNMERQSHRSEGIENTSTPQTSKLTSGTITLTNASGNAGFIYGPICLLTDGWDGRDVALILGDSQAFSDGDRGPSAGARGVIGPIQRGLDDTGSSTRRIPFANFAQSGSRPSGFLRSSGYALRRLEAIDAMRSVNGGRMPFTVVLSEHINNDVVSDTATLRSTMEAYFGVLRSEFPGVRIVQVSAMPKTSADASRWTTTAGQTVTAENADGGARWTVSGEMMAQSGNFLSLIDGSIDLRPIYTAGTGQDLWEPRSFSTTLAADITSATTTIRLTDAPPYDAEAPEMLGFDINGAGVNTTTRWYIQGVTGSGPYDVTLSVASPATVSAGVTVAAIPTRDGTHASAAYNLKALPAFRSAKQSGVLR